MGWRWLVLEWCTVVACMWLYTIWDGLAQNSRNREASIWMIANCNAFQGCIMWHHMLKTLILIEFHWINGMGQLRLNNEMLETTALAQPGDWNIRQHDVPSLELHRTNVNHVAVWAVASKQRVLQSWCHDRGIGWWNIAWIGAYWICSKVRLNNHIMLMSLGLVS